VNDHSYWFVSFEDDVALHLGDFNHPGKPSPAVTMIYTESEEVAASIRVDLRAGRMPSLRPNVTPPRAPDPNRILSSNVPDVIPVNV
jgi:hypothetical protein